MTDIDFGQPIPSNLEYAVSFSIPTWDLAIGYAEKDPLLVSKMVTGYPRFFPQPSVRKLSAYFVKKFGRESEGSRPFPSYNTALACIEFVKSVTGRKGTAHLEVENFIFEDSKSDLKEPSKLVVTIAAVLASDDEFEIVKEYWKLRGEIVSSRLAASLNQYLETINFTSELAKDQLVARLIFANKKGNEAKDLIKKRIVDNHCKPFGLRRKNSDLKDTNLNPEEDVYLVSSGMSTIFTARKILEFWEERQTSEYYLNKDYPNEIKKVSTCNTVAVFGFLFKNTQVIMKKFGKSLFFGFGDSKDLIELQKFLDTSEQRILAVFVETPSNPLLNMPDLEYLRRLADKYGFFIVVDDTIGGLNVDILAFADIVCTSLTKLFNGSSNVMGGSLILNPQSPLYLSASEYLTSDEFEDLLWCEDAIVLEKNSRDFEDRTLRTNLNTEKLLNKLLLPEVGKLFKKVYYPTVSSRDTYKNYEAVRSINGGYGSLFSLSFYDEADAEAFYDALNVFKGPSNGTNFTLVCPYVQIVHRSELLDVSKFGADPNLIRVSVGLEEFQWLQDVFSTAIETVRRRNSQNV